MHSNISTYLYRCMHVYAYTSEQTYEYINLQFLVSLRPSTFVYSYTEIWIYKKISMKSKLTYCLSFTFSHSYDSTWSVHDKTVIRPLKLKILCSNKVPLHWKLRKEWRYSDVQHHCIFILFVIFSEVARASYALWVWLYECIMGKNVWMYEYISSGSDNGSEGHFSDSQQLINHL
jgi:hypothetical protein